MTVSLSYTPSVSHQVWNPNRRSGHLSWLAREGGLEGCCCAQAVPQRVPDDVVRVARNREDGVTFEQIAADFGIHPMTLSKWMRQADVDDGAKPGTSRTESAELRELRRRNRLLEQENEVLRRAAAYLSQANLPGKGSTRS